MSRTSLRAAVLLLGFVAAVSSACGMLQPSNVSTVAPDALASLVAAPDGPLVLDARSPEEFAAGHVPGAVNIPFREVASRIAELAPFKERGVVTYCEHGPRSTLAARALAGAGFTKLWRLEGDMSRWRSEGRPIETAR
jgi:rhodanese-related sulfurtransferase